MSDEALFTDLYELTMLRAYLAGRMHAPAAFEFFVRRLPPRRAFLIAAGLAQALDYLEALRFDERELEYLARTVPLEPAHVEYLRTLRFTGDVDAVPEGTLVFPDEPLLRVVAPIPEAQLVETRLINILHFQTLLASKAARTVLAAPGKQLVDFGSRRAHGLEAGVLCARAAFIAGFAGTSNLLAGRRFGIPVYGTMAHSFVQAHDDELEAFRLFTRANPNTVLLLDTYDTERAAHGVVRLVREEGLAIRGVRIDSGDLGAHAHAVRRILDAAGLEQCSIFASGGLDEDELVRLAASDAPIDGFGVGTRLDTSADAPYLDCAYKLQEYGGRPRRKRSEGKATWPGQKQVFRKRAADGLLVEDVVTLVGDSQPGEPLLVPVMRGGRRLGAAEPLAMIRARAEAQIQSLPERLRMLETVPEPYPVRISERLHSLAAALDRAGPRGT
ncbi:MAG TPA: nicotinate phosphoribosyltransferase [Polyangiaceae bacterium]|nr:nicotinate phosphoribosyltransferase [Polyangiaceae bacterium]